MTVQKDLRRLLKDFILDTAKDHDLAVTLTLKQQDGPTRLDSIEASKNLRHFLNRLNKKAYGNAAQRFGKKVEVVPMLEASYAGRLHYHLALKNPFPTVAICRSAIIDCWSKTRWGYDEVDVQPIYSSGWIDYITKSKLTDVWDVENSHMVR